MLNHTQSSKIESNDTKLPSKEIFLKKFSSSDVTSQQKDLLHNTDTLPVQKANASTSQNSSEQIQVKNTINYGYESAHFSNEETTVDAGSFQSEQDRKPGKEESEKIRKTGENCA